MVPRIDMIILFACVVQAHAKELTALKAADPLDKLAARALKSEQFHHVDLENSTLGKSSHASLFPRTVRSIGSRTSAAPRYEPRSHRITRVSVYGLLHHADAHTLAALPAKPDDLKTALSMLRQLPSDWLSWYDHEVLEFPLKTKAMTSGVCYSIGDLCAQGIAGKNLSTLDVGRSAQSGAAGAIGYGPLAHYVLDFFDKSLSFGGAWWSVVPKIVLEEGPVALVYGTIYSMLMGAFQLQNPKEVLRHVRATVTRGLITSIRIMPVVDLITFTVIPIELQVLFTSVAEIVWVCIFSSIHNDDDSQIGLQGDEDKSEISIPAIELWNQTFGMMD